MTLHSTTSRRPSMPCETSSESAKTALGQLLNAECEDASVCRINGGISRAVHMHLPIDLLEEAKARSGLSSDEDVVQAALVHLILTDPAQYAGR